MDICAEYHENIYQDVDITETLFSLIIPLLPKISKYIWQDYALEKWYRVISNRVTKVVAVCAPTGFGKTKFIFETMLKNDKDTFNYSDGDASESLFKRKYFGPVDLMKLRIRLLDKFGRVVDLNKSDYSLTIMIEQLYDINSN